MGSVVFSGLFAPPPPSRAIQPIIDWIFAAVCGAPMVASSERANACPCPVPITVGLAPVPPVGLLSRLTGLRAETSGPSIPPAVTGLVWASLLGSFPEIRSRNTPETAVPLTPDHTRIPPANTAAIPMPDIPLFSVAIAGYSPGQPCGIFAFRPGATFERAHGPTTRPTTNPPQNLGDLSVFTTPFLLPSSRRP